MSKVNGVAIKHPLAGQTPFIRLKLLGTPQVLQDSWQDLSLDHACLLGIYLAYRQDWVNRQELADLFWSEGAHVRGKANLRQLLYRTRQYDWAETLETTQTQLRLIVPTDVHVFEEACLGADWQNALTFHQGEFLAGVVSKLPEFEAWLEQERSKLARAWSEAVLKYCWQLDNPERHHEATTLLKKLMVQDSLNEDALLLYLYHLYCLGDRTEALKHFLEFKELLARELGAVPLPVTEEVVRFIRNNQTLDRTTFYELLARPARDLSTALVSNQHLALHNLPDMNTVFIGRDHELADLCKALSQPQKRLISIVGIGGSGKTRLALEVAQQVQGTFRDGVIFVDLTPLNDPEHIASKVIEALKLELRGNVSAREKLLSYMADKEMLLILDNFEHLLRGAKLCSDLLDAAPNLHLLVSSREVLNLAVEWRYPIAGLKAPESNQGPLESFESIRLFLNRAQQVRLDFELDESTLYAVADICRLLGGLPLAIELIVTWLPLLGPESIAEDLKQGLTLLESDDPQLLKRHRSMQLVLEKSWQLLTTEEQHILKTLSVFSGSFERGAALELGHCSLLTLLTLSKKGLIQQTASGRLELSFLVQQFAAEKLDDEASKQLQHRHAQYYLAWVRSIRDLRRQDLRGWLSRLEQEMDNLRSVLSRFASTPISLQLCSEIVFYWELRAHVQEGLGYCSDILQQSHLPSPALVVVYAYAGGFATDALQVDKGRYFFKQSMELSESLNHPVSHMLALSLISYRLFSHYEEVELALEYHQTCLELAEKLHHQYFIALTYTHLCICYSYLNDLASAEAYGRKALTLLETVNNQAALASVYLFLADCEKAKRNHAQARHYYLASLKAHNDVSLSVSRAQALGRYGQFLYEQGNTAKGLELIQESLTLVRTERHTPIYSIASHNRMALVMQLEKKLDLAKGYLKDSLNMLREHSHVSALIYTLELFIIQYVLEEDYRLALTLASFVKRQHSTIKYYVAPRTAYEIAEQLDHHLATARNALNAKEQKLAQNSGQIQTWDTIFDLLN